MLSRGLPVVRLARLLKSKSTPRAQQIRNSHDWNYRTCGEPPSRTIENVATGIQGVAWWWVLWHLYTEPEHVLGEFEYPDPKQWTDEELGIPPLH